jgi:hypothetical protein
LKSFDRLHERSVIQLFGLLSTLCSHSVTPLELKKLLALLQVGNSVPELAKPDTGVSQLFVKYPILSQHLLTWS